MIAQIVYILCALTSIACAIMLLRGYGRTRARFLLYSSLCFTALMINNVMLFIEYVVYPDVVWLPAFWRSLVAFIGLALLLYGLIWDAE